MFLIKVCSHRSPLMLAFLETLEVLALKKAGPWRVGEEGGHRITWTKLPQRLNYFWKSYMKEKEENRSRMFKMICVQIESCPPFLIQNKQIMFLLLYYGTFFFNSQLKYLIPLLAMDCSKLLVENWSPFRATASCILLSNLYYRIFWWSYKYFL